MRVGARDTRSDDHVLVIVDRLPDPVSPDIEERRIAALLEEFANVTSEMTLLSSPPSRETVAEWFLGMGVRLVLEEVDWAAWLERHAFEFSHVVVHGLPLAHGYERVLSRTQAQAVRILGVGVPESLAYRALAPEIEPLEQGGYVDFLHAVREREDALLERANLIVCPTEAVGSELKSRGAEHTTVFPPAVLADDSRQAGPGDRSGLLFIGRFTSEPGAPDDEGIRWFLSEVRPLLAGLDARLRVFGEDVRPWMRHLPGTEIVFDSTLEDELRRARVVVAPRRYGATPVWSLLHAMGSGVPFVASPNAVTGFDLGRISAHVIAESADEFADLTAAFLVDDSAWQETSAALVESARHLADEHADDRQRLRERLWDLGLPPSRKVRTPVSSAPRLSVRPRGGTLADVHPGTLNFEAELLPRLEQEFDRDTMLRVQLSMLPDDRYALWRHIHEAKPADFETMTAQARSWSYQPTISVVMPTYETDPEMLRAALDSVAAQIYPTWELCVADDASSSDEVREILERFGSGDPRVKLRFLVENQGIAGASNAALELATGDFVALMDHDDVLHPEALYWVARLLDHRPELDFIYTDEDKIDGAGVRTTPFFKPDWSPDLLHRVNYIAHLSVMRRELIETVGGFRTGFDGSQDFDLFLRVTELTDQIAHIPRPLYSWRTHEESTAASLDSKPYADIAGQAALRDALHRQRLEADVQTGHAPTFYRPRFALSGQPRVAIAIPTRDRVQLVSACVEAALAHTTYKNLEVVVIDNESVEPATLEYLDQFEGRVLSYPHRFNYARMMNLATLHLNADYLVLLNNDAVVRTDDWIEAMLEYAQRPEVGVVGSRLFFPDGRSQHEGIVLGVGGVAYNLDATDYFGLGEFVRDCAGVTGACLMTRRSVFWEVGGFDERLRVAYNDVDYCLRVGERGYRVIYTPEVELEHPESASRGSLHPENDERYFQERWGQPRSIRDPFHNPNVDLVHPLILRV